VSGETRKHQPHLLRLPCGHRGVRVVFHGLHRRVTVSVSRSRIGFLTGSVCVNRECVCLVCAPGSDRIPPVTTVLRTKVAVRPKLVKLKGSSRGSRRGTAEPVWPTRDHAGPSRPCRMFSPRPTAMRFKLKLRSSRRVALGAALASCSSKRPKDFGALYLRLFVEAPCSHPPSGLFAVAMYYKA